MALAYASITCAPVLWLRMQVLGMAVECEVGVLLTDVQVWKCWCGSAGVGVLLTDVQVGARPWAGCMQAPVVCGPKMMAGSLHQTKFHMGVREHMHICVDACSDFKSVLWGVWQ